MMAFRMGCQSQACVRVKAGARCINVMHVQKHVYSCIKGRMCAHHTYFGPGVQRYWWWIGDTATATTVCNDSCSGAVGEPRRCSTIGEIALRLHHCCHQQGEWWSGHKCCHANRCLRAFLQMGDKGKTNMKCLSMESGHHEPPEQLQCSLRSLLNSSGGMNTIPPQDIPSFIYTTFIESGNLIEIKISFARETYSTTDRKNKQSQM